MRRYLVFMLFLGAFSTIQANEMATLKIVLNEATPLRYPTEEDVYEVQVDLVNVANQPVEVACQLLRMRGLDIRYSSGITGSHVDGRFSLVDPALANRLEILQPGGACRISLALDRETIDRVRVTASEKIRVRAALPSIPEMRGVDGAIVFDILMSE